MSSSIAALDEVGRRVLVDLPAPDATRLATILAGPETIDGEPMVKLRWDFSGDYGAWVPAGWVRPVVAIVK